MELIIFILVKVTLNIMFGLSLKRVIKEVLTATLRYKRSPTTIHRLVRTLVIKAEVFVICLIMVVYGLTSKAHTPYNGLWYVTVVGIIFLFMTHRVANVDSRIVQRQVRLNQKEEERTSKTPTQEEGA